MEQFTEIVLREMRLLNNINEEHKMPKCKYCGETMWMCEHQKEYRRGYKEGKKELKTTNDSKPCIWSQEEFDEYNMWNTECGESFCLETDTPKENKMNYCCYCGKKLRLA